MTLLPRVTHAVELIDAPDQDPAVLAESMGQVAGVNRWLGGRRALLRHLHELLPPGGPATILDAGTGTGDLPRAIVEHARRIGRDVRVHATDVWRGNRLTRHDGPLSVRRSFTARELERLAHDAGFAGARVYRHVPFRVVLVIPAGDA